MHEAMIRDAARALVARLKELLDQGMAPQVVLTREEALLAQRFAEKDLQKASPTC